MDLNLPEVNLNEIIAATLDAGDHASACLAILAHPHSARLSRLTVERLYDFGANGEVPDRFDVVMIEALGDLMRLGEPLQ